MYTQLYTHIFIYIFAYTIIYIYIYIHICVHNYIHIYLHKHCNEYIILDEEEYYMNKCLTCNSTISNNKKYCDSKCKRKYRYDTQLFKKSCIICGNEFTAKEGVKCCSKECFLKSQRIYAKRCANCGKEFMGRGNGLYCSESCYKFINNLKYKYTISRCEICGKDITHEKDKQPARLICSKSCSSKYISLQAKKAIIDLYGTTRKSLIRKMVGLYE